MPPCKVRAANRAATLRKMTSSLSQHDDESLSSSAAAANAADHNADHASRIMTERTESMASRASSKLPLTRRERNDVANSLRNIAPAAEGAAAIDWEALEGLLSEAAHLSHKDWGVTGSNSERMARILLGGGGPPPPRDDDDDGNDTANSNDAAANSNKNGNGKGSTTLSESPAWNQMFERILHEGNWDGALAHAAKNNNDDGRSSNNNAAGAASTADAKPWAVLVTGVNGIRKTTSVYQPWFSEVLREALVVPRPSSSSEFESQSQSKEEEEEEDNKKEKDGVSLRDLPNGENSFFRQLDHMITTLCNEDFSLLYALTAAQLETESNSDEDEGGGASGGTNANADTNSTTTTTEQPHNPPQLDPPPSKELVKRYSNLKASIFSRYRTLSELLGVLLLREARTLGINVMCETSGRDIAMFRYIDHFFPEEEEDDEEKCGGGGDCGDNRSSYNKLALHFTIDDLSHAERSVDERMAREMTAGREAVRSGDVVEVIYANAGGPYGSEVLEGVRADSERVWNEVVMKGGGEGGGVSGGVGEDWYKAVMRINAHDEKPWTIRAVRPDGSLGTEYTFGDARTV